ncbi:MAG: hypothetical protein ACLSWI_07845 [Candidatus Gastranaerophilaceae bacterium]
MNKFKGLLLLIAISAGLNVYAVTQAPVSKTPVNLASPMQTQAKTYQCVNPLDLVARPNFYLNKYVKVKAKFDKFSTLGLDYKPAFRSSEDYISFLIQRPDVTDHNIPLSEMKIFLKRAEAEKHIDLNSGDEVEFTGKIFSNVLGDVWMDVDNFKVLTVKPKSTEKK